MVRLRNTVRQDFHYGASKDLFEKAQNLRKIMTPAEKELWKHIRNRKFHNLKFRRQHPIKYFIADFYCHEKRLVIEIDGSVHNEDYQIERDENRTIELEELQIEVIRFSNNEVMNHVDYVLNKIKSAIE